MRLTFIRKEQPEDRETVRHINEAAFETSTEAEIVDALREQCSEHLSLVAVSDEEVVAHILFTPATIDAENGSNEIKGMGLAPMAVLPAYQRQGFGSALVQKGLELLQQAGWPFVAVLGHPEYYPRFGFERAADYSLSPAFEGVPEEAFMIKLFDERLSGAGPGVVRYRPEFSAAVP